MIKGAAMMGLFALLLFAGKAQAKKRLQPAENAGWSKCRLDSEVLRSPAFVRDSMTKAT
jgi:hypothetical protein